MQPVPTDLILHALAENLIGIEGDDESLHSLGHTILRTCIDTRALPAQWCNGAGVGQQMSWLTRRIVDGDTPPHVAAETRAMEVAISRRLADTAFSLLVTQDDSNKTAALTLLEASHRIVGLPSAEDTASWQSRVLALEGQIKAAVGLAAAHFEDVKTARDEADTLRQKVGQLDAVIETNKRLQQAVQSLRETLKSDNTPKPTAERLTWIARFNNGNGGVSLTLDGRTVLVTGKMADDLAEALHPRRQYVADLKDKVATLERYRRDIATLKAERDEFEAVAEANLADMNAARGEADALRQKVATLERDHAALGFTARQVIERRIGDMAAVCDALKLDREASHEDIIETIKSLQADRAALVDDIKQRDAERAIRSMSKTDRRACPHRPDGDTSACDHCCLFG